VGWIYKLGKTRNAFKVLVRKPLGERLLGIWKGWEHSINMNSRKLGYADGN
jgi:hypothetical protein